ncbi:MAG: hypothetical protein WBV80_10230 [Mycobacterium sp.]
MKRNMLALGLALFALLVALVVGLLVAPYAHTDTDDDFYSAAKSSVLTVNLVRENALRASAWG